MYDYSYRESMKVDTLRTLKRFNSRKHVNYLLRSDKHNIFSTSKQNWDQPVATRTIDIWILLELDQIALNTIHVVKDFEDEEEDEKEELMTASMDGVIGNVFPDIGTLFVLETFDNRQIDIERTLVSSLFNLRTFATLV